MDRPSNRNLARFQQAAAKAGVGNAARKASSHSTRKKVLLQHHDPEPMKIEGKILIVDALPRVAQMLANQVHGQHFETIVTGDGMEAVMLLQVEKITAVIIAREPADMPAYTCCSKIRACEQGREVPILIATEDYSKAARQEAQMMEATDIVRRPYKIPELMETLRAALGEE